MQNVPENEVNLKKGNTVIDESTSSQKGRMIQIDDYEPSDERAHPSQDDDTTNPRQINQVESIPNKKKYNESIRKHPIINS